METYSAMEVDCHVPKDDKRLDIMEKISPRVDIAFKKIFGVEENTDLLISLINSIVSAEDQVSEVTLLNPYNAKNFKHDKVSILDIKARGACGKRFNIEIQLSDEADYDKRALYYWAKLYTEQLKAAGGYSQLSKAIGIHILNFTSILEVDKYHNVFHIKEKETGLLYFKDLELHTIELKKFSQNAREELTEMLARVKNSLDMWVAFLTRHDLMNKDNLPAALDNPALKKALDVLDVMNFADEEREAYEAHLKWLMIEASTLKKSEAKGEIKGEANMLIFLLECKFTTIPAHYRQMIQQASAERLQNWAKQIFTCLTMEEVFGERSLAISNYEHEQS